jgi:hypothetical protein
MKLESTKKKEDKTKYNKLKKIGFRKLRRTTDNLLFLTQKVKEQFNRKKKVCTLFFDISKAFDKVWHAGLLYKLKLFIIDEKIPRIPPVYKLKTFNNKILTRSFYEQEIQVVKENEFPINTFEVLEFDKEKILVKKLNEEKAEPYWVNKKQFLNE